MATSLGYTGYDVSYRQQNSKSQKVYAKAIYDNIAESPDELAFKKGDILNVIEQDTDGLDGWWLCTLRGRQGICPGNRLRIINSYDSGCFSPSPASSPCPSLGASTATLNSSILSSSDTYENSSVFQQRLGKRRSWHITPHKVITPQRCGDVYLYDLLSPPTTCSSPYQNLSIMSDTEAYDTPRSATSCSSNLPMTPTLPQSGGITPVNYDCPKNWSSHKSQNIFGTGISKDVPRPDIDSYDIPRPINHIQHQQNITPSSSNSSLLTSDSLSLSSSNRSSLTTMPDYDIPRRNPQPVFARNHENLMNNQHHHAYNLQHHHIHQQQQQQQHQQQHNYPHNQSSTYDIPNQGNLQFQQQQQHHNFQQQQHTEKGTTLPVTKELPLELSSALETLAKLQNEATSAITKLLAFVTPNWRSPEKLEPALMDIKLAAVRLRTALHDLAEFGEGALGNATRADDKNLSLKLRPLVKALRDADRLINDTSEALKFQGWTVESLSRKDEKCVHPPDSLDQLIACALTLTEDVRQSTSFIQGNASLLFKRMIKTPTSLENNAKEINVNTNGSKTTENSTGSNHEWLEDYDYVSLESKDSAAKKNSELRDAIPQNLKKKFDNVLKTAETTAITATKSTNELNSSDKLLIKYYAVQITTHMAYLTQAIESFLETVARNQPPKFFIAYGKFVVLSAHNLVSIGDIVHRNVSKPDLKSRIEQYTDSLSDALKSCVTKSKKAAQHFPSVTAVQEMVDSVVDISHLARDLKIAMLQAVQT